ncbi:MAG: tRNA uridine-5-carboxymethylaminomethyl(34) synthesis GTPase MnmE [Gemmatimonadota bacterium]|nr:tRNA uridine-5-carboxymethylaminomethyl(34) synthesis GTPase MnmE [Gemmatimonadota bacterium]
MLSDVIAAVSTPPGRSAIAVVRISGTGAHDLSAKVIEGFTALPYRTVRHARIKDSKSGEHIDDVLYTVFPEDGSYTGEELVEISTHGGLLAPTETLRALLAVGARQAAPGEFTRRAVLNGKMDLLQAEAVLDLIDATAPLQRKMALNQMDRGLSRRIAALRERAIELEALLGYEIDFPEEDSGPLKPERIDASLKRLTDDLKTLLKTGAEGERLREGALAVVAGQPNAGKSSLFNALVGRERAIVTEIPGTTRDAIEAHVTCDGFPFRLVDTAGLRRTEDRIEKIGVEVSMDFLLQADLVVYCFPADNPLDETDAGFLEGLNCPVVLVETKADLKESDSEKDENHISVSAEKGTGLGELRSRLARTAFQGFLNQAQIAPHLTRERHRIAVNTALDELVQFGRVRSEGLEPAVSAVHITAAVRALEEVIGVVTTEDVLERLFGEFCVGK